MFAWTYSEISTLLLQLVIESNKRPIKLASRHMSPHLATKIEAKVDTLVKAGFIREAQ